MHECDSHIANANVMHHASQQQVHISSPMIQNYASIDCSYSKATRAAMKDGLLGLQPHTDTQRHARERAHTENTQENTQKTQRKHRENTQNKTEKAERGNKEHTKKTSTVVVTGFDWF